MNLSPSLGPDQVTTRTNPMFRVWVRICEIWANPLRCYETPPDMLTAAEIGQRVNASTTSVRRAMRKLEETHDVKKDAGPPVRWKIVFKDGNGKEINP